MNNRIVLVGSLPPPHHGSTIYFQNLLSSQIRQKFEIYHLDTSDRRNHDNIGKLDVSNVYLALKNIVELFFTCLLKKPRIVYIPISQALLPYLRDGLFIIVSKITGVKTVIIHLHGSHFREVYDQSNALGHLFIKTTLSFVDIGIVLSNNLRKIFVGLISNIVVVENGIPDDQTKDKSIKRGTDRKIRIGFLGSLMKAKGVLDLLHAASIVSKTRRDVEFCFVGNWRKGETGTEIEAMEIIRSDRLKEFVIFLGPLYGSEKWEFVRSVDIFAFPSWDEGFPLVILEAMASSKPVVSSDDVGSIPEVVVDGITGLLIEKQNPVKLAQALLYLIQNSEIREQMGFAARKRFDENYTLERNISKMMDLFQKALNN